MDYVIGSVAALISGNVTPNRPKLIRRAITPTKHQPSPNITPKSELVEDRSIFLSPTLQKKKAIVKKSPKRIFQNPDLDTTEDCEGNSISNSPKADKVKKHLKDDLDADIMAKKKPVSLNSSNDNLNNSSEVSPKKKSKNLINNDNTPNKKKKKRNISELNEDEIVLTSEVTEQNESVILTKSPKKMKQRCNAKSVADVNIDDKQTDTQNKSPKKAKSKDNQDENVEAIEQNKKKKNKKVKKNKKLEQIENSQVTKPEDAEIIECPKKKNKKKKNKSKTSKQIKTAKMETENQSSDDDDDDDEEKSKNIANPNAITEKDTDSEHDSDDEIQSDNEQENEQILNKEENNQSSDEEEEEGKDDLSKKSKQNKDKQDKDNKQGKMSEEEIKRTLFVGNVPFSTKCKKEIKKIFKQYGQIETIRIRTIPVKDARVTPKLAVIKNELHPERSTVNVYVKYADEESVTKALFANNTVLNNHHLRVSRSISTGAEHDPDLAVFVGNLPFGVEDETLRGTFQGCGEIVSVRVVRDKKTNAGKGFGYVNFATKDSVELALAMTEEDLTIKNKIIRVKRCTKSGNKGLRKLGGNQKYGAKWNNNQDRYQRNNRSQGNTQRWNQDRGNQAQRDGRSQGKSQRWNQERGNQGFRGNQRNQGKAWGQKEETGAARRVNFKRKQQDAGEGPPNKKQNINKEKKPKKEFVGMTAEKKKKQKFDKDAKKKKALSEILSKKM